MNEGRILIVDDNKDNLKMYHQYLAGCGYEVDLATDAQSAIDKIDSQSFNIVITDKNMPGIVNENEGGMDVLNYVQKHCPATSSIMMTGYATIDTAIDAMKAGAIDYLKKPFNPKELKKKIERILTYQHGLQPENLITSYSAIKDGLLQAMEHASQGNYEVLDTIEDFTDKLDVLLKTIKDREFVLLEQRDALTNIGAMAAETIELLEEDADQADILRLLQDIMKESVNRF